MENKEFSKQLQNRTKVFAIRIIRLSANLPNTVEGKIIRNQITKAGTSVGANYREASRARSKADFKNKIKICESESDETLYWLEIIRDMEWSLERDAHREADELLSIFSSIGRTLSSS